MAILMKELGLAALVACVAACGQAAVPSAPLPPEVLPLLAIVSGNSQAGTLGEVLAQPLVVRVTDAAGAGVAGVSVRWTAIAGAGEFGSPTPATQTAADGMALISFRPTGTSNVTGVTVTATGDGLKGSPLLFTFHVLPPDVPAEVLIPFGPVFDCTGGADPSIFVGPQGTIPVGALVVWEYAPGLSGLCAARLRSISVPPGASSFESGPIAPGERFGAILGVAGDWVVRDVMYGGAVTLRVR